MLQNASGYSFYRFWLIKFKSAGGGGVKLLPHIRLRLIDSNFIIARCKLIYPLVIYLFLLCFCDILVAFNAFWNFYGI